MTNECEIFLKSTFFSMLTFQIFSYISIIFHLIHENYFHLCSLSRGKMPLSNCHLAQNTAQKNRYQFFKVYDMIRTIYRYFTGKKVFQYVLHPSCHGRSYLDWRQ